MEPPALKPLLYPLVCLALALGAASAAAATYEQRLIAHLRKLGYGDITLSFTLLGRAQIFAVSKNDTREIVLNPRTGEILRDVAQTIESDGVEAVAIAVAPIVLAPEIETTVGSPLDPPPADLLPDPVPGAGPEGQGDPAGTLVDIGLPDTATPDVPELTNPSATGTDPGMAEPDSTPEAFDSGVAP